jgi:MarR family transcriptional regulator for hemolysin
VAWGRAAQRSVEELRAVPKSAKDPGIGALLGETGRAWRYRLDQRLKPLGLSQAKWITLLKLSCADEGMTQTELADRLGVEGPTLARLLDRMAADSWIERRESDEDRRSKTGSLRPKACGLLERITAVAMQLNADLLEGVPVGDLRCCMEVLQRIKERALSLDSATDASDSSPGSGAPKSPRDHARPRVRRNKK